MISHNSEKSRYMELYNSESSHCSRAVRLGYLLFAYSSWNCWETVLPTIRLCDGLFTDTHIGHVSFSPYKKFYLSWLLKLYDHRHVKNYLNARMNMKYSNLTVQLFSLIRVFPFHLYCILILGHLKMKTQGAD